MNFCEYCLIFAGFLVIQLGIGSCDGEVPPAQVSFFEGGGFEVSLPADPKINSFSIHGKKNQNIFETFIGTWHQNVKRTTDNRFVFRDANAQFNLGDRLHYFLYMVYDGRYHILHDTAEVKGKLEMEEQSPKY